MSRKSEEERRADLIAATIREIGVAGSLNVPISQIAKSAGVSSGLAFHYFQDKDSLFLAAMRAVLKNYASDVRVALCGADTADKRLEAIALASFSGSSLRRSAISAWVNFYALALKSEPARHLLHVYHRRLHSNLVYALRPKVGEHAPDVARRIAGLIDGLYLRHSLEQHSIRGLDRTTFELDGTEGSEHILYAIAAECAQIHTHNIIMVDHIDPDPMAPLAGPQE